MANLQVEDLEFKIIENIPSWAAFKPEIAKKDGIEYHRKKGSKVVYKKIDDGLQCMSCDSEIQAAEVAHPVHDGPFPLSGSGRCRYEQVPYCPKCEEIPKYHGSFITLK